MSEFELKLWTIYDHPTDYPNGYIARRFEIDRTNHQPVATRDTKTASNLIELRREMKSMQLFKITRSPNDDPKIVESWI